MRPLMLASALAALAPGTASAARPPSLDRALVRRVPEVIRFLKQKGYANVGVLKFEGGRGLRDNRGTLNRGLADRLQVALLLANASDSIRILRDASDVAAKTPGADHRTADGRRRLFAASYRLAWGVGQPVKADAFVTGRFVAKKKLRLMSVTLFVVAPPGKGGPRQVGKPFDVRTDPQLLGEMGKSFVLRKTVIRGGTSKLVKQDPVVSADKIDRGKADHPLKSDDVPIKLEVLYNGTPAKVTYSGGKAFVPPPKKGEAVHLVLTRDGTRKRYGVVVKVNGQSTWKKEKDADDQCLRWILDPGSPPYTIKGYQIDLDKYDRFHVLSDEESVGREHEYGAEVGVICVTVYEEGSRKPKDRDDGDESQAVALVRRRVVPRGPTLADLRNKLRLNGKRALIVPSQGPPASNPVQMVSFKNPRRVLSYSVAYRSAPPAPRQGND
jgi:hypothetical protein